MDNAKEKTPKKQGGLASELYFWAQALVIALIVLVCVNTFLFRISGVDGSSMNPTLSDHDQIIMRIIGYNKPERGDIIVVVSQAFDHEPLVKRVIGIAGDVIDIDESGRVIRNGEVLSEAYINEPNMVLGSTQYPFTVPENQAFVMGDNRNHSTDSRFIEVGALPYDEIIGKVVLRLWPLNQFGTVN